MISTVHYTDIDPGCCWEKNSNPAITCDSALDSLSVLTPNVVKLPEGGFRMYYTGKGEIAGPGITFGYILSAVSDDGKYWRKEPGIRIPVSLEHSEEAVLCPEVIPLQDGRWRMYFESRIRGRCSVVLSASSGDGLTWEREPGTRVCSTDAALGSPKCHYFSRDDDPKTLFYRLYFHSYPNPFRTGLDANNVIKSAVSNDGLHFTFEPGIRISQTSEQRESYSVYAPEIVRLGSGAYRLFYSGWGTTIRGGIFTATSADGVIWQKKTEPILDLGGAYDNAMLSEPCIIEVSRNRFNMYYEAEDTGGERRILCATAKQ